MYTSLLYIFPSQLPHTELADVLLLCTCMCNLCQPEHSVGKLHRNLLHDYGKQLASRCPYLHRQNSVPTPHSHCISLWWDDF